MKKQVVVKVESWTDYNDFTHEKLLVDGKRVFSVHPLCECPEDAIIGRDLLSCGDVADFLADFLNKYRDYEVKFEYAEVPGKK
jgi:hypothetical protein